MVTIELKPNKEYEWFLKTIKPAHRAGGLRLHLVWAGVDVDYEVTEWPMLGPNNEPGPRLIELMQRVNGGILPGSKPMNPFDGLKRGTHLFAKVNRHWTETKSDEIKWEFVYESIKPLPTKEVFELTDTMRNRVKFRANQSKSYEEARDKLKAEGGEFVKALEQMVKSGEVVFA